jgi:limonene-1,2-epoxide hydrolase
MTIESMPGTREVATSLCVEFLHRLQAGDLDGACSLLSSDVEYINVSLPTIRGRDEVRRALGRMMGLKGAGFEVVIHAAAADGDVVLTDRTDVLILGRVRIEFWVYGRFVVRDGEIAMWRDSFDWLNLTVAALRGVLRAALRRR